MVCGMVIMVLYGMIEIDFSNLFQTNIPFLLNVLQHSEFLDGAVDTDFIKENPQLFEIATSQNRAQKLLHYLGNVMINGPVTPLATSIKPSAIEPQVPKVRKLLLYPSIDSTMVNVYVFQGCLILNLYRKQFRTHRGILYVLDKT